MSKKPRSGMTVDEVVAQVIANAGLEGHELDDETIEVVRKIASGEMTKDEATAWRRERAQDASRRFEKATAQIAAEARFGGPDAKSTELEIMEEASRLVAEARFAEYDLLARFGGDRDELRAKLLASNENEVLFENMGVADPEAVALLEVPVGNVALEDLEAMVAKLRLMANDPVIMALPRIREMGHEEIAQTNAAGQPAYVSDGRGGIIRIVPDGSRHPLDMP